MACSGSPAESGAGLGVEYGDDRGIVGQAAYFIVEGQGVGIPRLLLDAETEMGAALLRRRPKDVQGASASGTARAT